MKHFAIGLFVGMCVAGLAAQNVNMSVPIEDGHIRAVFPGQPHIRTGQKYIDHDAYIPLVRCVNVESK